MQTVSNFPLTGMILAILLGGLGLGLLAGLGSSTPGDIPGCVKRATILSGGPAGVEASLVSVIVLMAVSIYILERACRK